MNMSTGLDEIFDTLIENLEIVINKVKDDDSHQQSAEFNLEEFWVKLGSAFDRVSVEATKLALCFSKPPLPSLEECRSLIGQGEMAILTLVAVFYGLPKDQGVILHKMTRLTVLRAVQGIVSLVQQIKQDKFNSSQAQLRATGNVWEQCDAFKALPRNNRDALFGALKDAQGLVTDAADELKELLETDGESTADWSHLDQLTGAGDAPGSTDNDDAWTARDRTIIPPCTGILQATRSCLKKVSGAVKSNGQWEEAKLVVELDAIGSFADCVSPAVDDMVMCLYPPMRMDAVRQNAKLLAGVIINLLDGATVSHVTKDEDSHWLTFLRKAVDHNVARITELTLDAVETCDVT